MLSSDVPPAFHRVIAAEYLQRIETVLVLKLIIFIVGWWLLN